MKNIVLISIDNLRFDCIGYQPDKRELVKYDVLKYLETPTLDRIAENSLCFTQCISTNTYTTAAHASILTGLYPPRHGVRGFYEKKLSRDVYSMAEVLKMFGYETVMLTDTQNLFVPVELHRGFDHVFFIEETEVLRFLEENRGKKLFIFLHLYDVHEPFLLSKNSRYNSAEYLDALNSLYEKHNLTMDSALRTDFKHNRRLWMRLLDHIGYKTHREFFPLYVRGVSRFDQGRFRYVMEEMDALGLLKDSLLVIVSDHGEGKSDESKPDHFTHGVKLFDSVIRVPLMVYHQDISHQVVENIVSVVDIFPTILDFALGNEGADLLPYALDGVSLRDQRPDEERFVYSETWRRDDNKTFTAPVIFLSCFLEQRCVRTNRYKYIINGEPEGLELRDYVHTLSDEEFIQYAYRGLLLKFEWHGDYLSVLRNLKTQYYAREEFLAQILSSDEYTSRPQRVMYDLQNDPFEDSPAGIARVSDRNPESNKFFDTIIEISKNPVKADDIFPGGKDAIISIMKNSGTEDWEEKAGILLNNKHLLAGLIDDFLHRRRISDIARDRKYVEKVVLSSKEFSLFLYDRLSRRSVALALIKGALSKYVSYGRQVRIYNFFNLKIFPDKTLRGKAWRRVLSKILNA